ncbi:MAG: FAD:protein FMN transferase [Oscillospiraceae bacterium]
MDTIMSLELWEGGSQEQLNQAVEQLYQWEDLWSATDEDSEIWAADHSGGEWVTLSGDTVDLLSQALDLCRLTGGALDLTAYSAVKAWGFTTGEYRVPGEEELAALADGIDHAGGAGSGCLPGSPARRDGAGPGGGGQGLCRGASGGAAAGAGVTSRSAEPERQCQTVGGKPDAPLVGGVRTRPPERVDNLLAIQVVDQAVVTSGSYQRYFQQDGQTYWHILDPETAAPARTGLASVTVVGPDGTVCDGLATALFVLGEEAGIELWRAHPELGVQVIWVREDGSVALTEGLEENYQVNPQHRGLDTVDGGGGMNKRTALLAALLAGAVLLCAGVIWRQHRGPGGGVLARVYQRGELVEDPPGPDCRSHTLPTDREGRKTWWRWRRADPGSSHATCPDRVCVTPRWISSSTVPVVCLPQRVIVEIVGVRLWTTAAGWRPPGSQMALLTAIALTIFMAGADP